MEQIVAITAIKMNLSEIRSIMRERKLAPNSRYGQNFLHDENLARWIVHATGVREGSRVLEIGPGLGAITEFILEAGAEVVSIEIDNGLADYLEERFQGKKIKIVRGDAMKIFKNITEDFDIIAGNLPYNVAVPIIIQTALSGQCLGRFVWMVQSEIAKRIMAPPSTSNYGAASVILQIFCKILSCRSVGQKVFYPQPAVQSTIVIMEPCSKRSDIFSQQDTKEDFKSFVRFAFSERRKMLVNILSKFPGWDESILVNSHICGKQRPEQIHPESWLNLFLELHQRKIFLSLDN